MNIDKQTPRHEQMDSHELEPANLDSSLQIRILQKNTISFASKPGGEYMSNGPICDH